jgi:AraC-like DNA-binding protein
MLKKDRYRGNTFFKNPEYLDAIRAFKKYYGISPTDFRKNNIVNH